MKIFDSKSNFIQIDELKKKLKGRRCYLWGNTSNNETLFNFISPMLFEGIFDNNPQAWDTYTKYGLKILKPSFFENIVIVTAMGDPYSDLLIQLSQIGIKEFFFFRTDELLDRYENFELPIYRASTNKFLIKKQKFKYIHIINDEKFIRTLFFVYSQGWDLSEHAFVINYFNRCNPKDIYNLWKLYIKYDKELNNILVFDGIFNQRNELNKRQKCLESLIKTSSKIIFHGEYIPLSISYVIKNSIAEIKRKGVFIPWCSKFGCDYKIKQNIDDYLRFVPILVLNNFGEKRKQEIEKFCNFEAVKYLQINLSYNYPICCNSSKKIPHLKPKVLISHSCFFYNKCIESIDILTPYRGLIDVYCIGSYGDQSYIRQVEEYGQNILGNSFYFVKNFMSDEDYTKFIEQMDCAVISMEQGAGMTTMHLLCYFGAKIFTVKGSDTDVFTSARGYKTYDISRIGKISVEELTSPNEYKQNNYEVAKAKFDLKTHIINWKIIFDE